MRWSLFKDGGRWVIRRWEDGRFLRLPVSQYRSMRHDEEALRQFLLRLNAPVAAKEKVAFKHAFIGTALLDDYKAFLFAQIPTEKVAGVDYHYLVAYALNYFIGALDLMNPVDWHRVHETKWAEFLCSEEAPASASAKQDIVRSLNRFVAWLHRQRPEEVPPLLFQPLSRAKIRELEAARTMRGEKKERKYIPDEDWNYIFSSADDRVRYFAQLAYSYGFRRAEVLALEPDDVKKGHIHCQRQRRNLNDYAPLKGREARRIPHWFATPADTFKWITEAAKHRMHPDTLTDRWNALMASLDLPYDFHDLRHTFITRAARVYKADLLLVRDAAGHKDIKTTQGYLHDMPAVDDEIFVPEAVTAE